MARPNAGRRRSVQSAESPNEQQHGNRHAKKPEQCITTHNDLHCVVGAITRHRNQGSDGVAASGGPCYSFGPIPAATGHDTYLILERLEAARLEGWPQAPSVGPSFETRSFGPLLRMRDERDGARGAAWKSSSSSSSTASRSARSTASSPSAIRWCSASS